MAAAAAAAVVWFEYSFLGGEGVGGGLWVRACLRQGLSMKLMLTSNSRPSCFHLSDAQ